MKHKSPNTVSAAFSYIQQYRSLSSLKAELESARRKLSLRQTWYTMEQGITRLTGCYNNGGCKLAKEMLAGIHSLSKSLNHTIIGSKYSLECPINGSGPLVYTPGFTLHPFSSWACARTRKVVTRAGSLPSLGVHDRRPFFY